MELGIDCTVKEPQETNVRCESGLFEEKKKKTQIYRVWRTSNAAKRRRVCTMKEPQVTNARVDYSKRRKPKCTKAKQHEDNQVVT
jgi:hypothetical protein